MKMPFVNNKPIRLIELFGGHLLGYRTWLSGCSQDYFLDWWNAPYKAESEDEDKE